MTRIIPFALLLCACLTHAQQPAWYTTHAHGNYQPTLYIVGVGAADGANAIEKAKRNAQVDIVSQIKVQVKGEMKNVTESFQLNKNESIFSDFTSRSRTVVNEEITGIAIVETFVDPATQTAYALAALDRAQYAQSLADEMNAAWKQSMDLRSAADEFLKRGKLTDALHNCAEARKLIVGALPKKALHDAVAGRSFTPPNASSPVSLTADMRTMLSNVRIEKTAGDRQTGKIGTRFGVPLAVRLEYEGVPVTGAALIFESTDNVPLFETATDGKGEAAYTGCFRSLSGNAIRVKPALGELSKEFDKSVLASAALFTFTPQPSAIGIELAVTGIQGQAAENMKSTLAAAVGRIGYRIVPSSRYKLDTVLRPKPASKIESMSGPLYTVQVEAVSTLTDKQSNAALGSVSSMASGGGRSEADAVAKASGLLSPDRMKLAELIERIGQ